MQLAPGNQSADAGVTQQTPNAGELEHEGKNLPPGISLVLLPRLLLLRVHHFRILLTHACLRAKGEAAPAVLVNHLLQQPQFNSHKDNFSPVSMQTMLLRLERCP